MSSTKKQTPNTNKNVTRKKRIKKVGESCVEKDEQCQRGSRCVNTKEYGKVCIDKNELEMQKEARKDDTLKEPRMATDVQEDPDQTPLLVNDEIERSVAEEAKEEEKEEEKEETAYTPTTQQEQLLKDY